MATVSIFSYLISHVFALFIFVCLIAVSREFFSPVYRHNRQHTASARLKETDAGDRNKLPLCQSLQTPNRNTIREYHKQNWIVRFQISRRRQSITLRIVSE